jgi:mycothiol S-conjugate amidase
MQHGLLFVLAHPDDETLCGGTMAAYADAGVPVTVVCATRGEAGEIAEGSPATQETLGEFRERELRAACGILGVRDVRFLDYRDSGMAGTPENDDPRSLNRALEEDVVDALVHVIRDVRPAAVIAWDASGGYGHPDHIAVHRCATAAFHAAGNNSRVAGEGEPWQAGALWYYLVPVDDFDRAMRELVERGIAVEGGGPGDPEEMLALPRVPANCVIDVSVQYERKQRAWFAHATQLDTFDVFLKMPDDMRARLLSSEHFHRAAPPLDDGGTLGDLLEGVERIEKGDAGLR